MARAAEDAWGGMRRIARDSPTLLDEVRRAGRGRTARSAAARPGIERAPGAGRARCGTGTTGKVALEYLFWAGEVGAARRVNFERHYDLIERVLPPEVLGTPDPDASRTRTASWSGSPPVPTAVATEPDLRDYFRLPATASGSGSPSSSRRGSCCRSTVDGLARARLSLAGRAAAAPGRGAGRCSRPFDSLIWFRDRTERLFDFRYRIEI